MLYKLEGALSRPLELISSAQSTERLLGTGGSSKTILNMMRKVLLPQFVSVKTL